MIYLGVIEHEDTLITNVESRPCHINDIGNSIIDIYNLLGVLNLEGNIMSGVKEIPLSDYSDQLGGYNESFFNWTSVEFKPGIWTYEITDWYHLSLKLRDRMTFLFTRVSNHRN